MFQTPLLSIEPFLFAKAEYANPTGSVKDRAAHYLLAEAERSGCLGPGGRVIEATSGNMGIALAALCKLKGYACTIVMPDSMSPERQQRMLTLGAELVLTPGALGMMGAEAEAIRLAKAIPGSFLTRQFENSANALAHVCTTGPEIWQQTGGKLDFFVAGVGTGGSFSGTARYLKEQNSHIRMVAVEPAKSPLLSQGTAGNHGIQGIGANFVPALLDRGLIDEVITVTDEDAFAVAKELGQTGIPAGISAGANVWAARLLAARHPGKTVVTLLPDHADRYASLGL